ncbi:MAG: phospholipase D-like domain-containing protein [Chloroflexota bacterium]
MMRALSQRSRWLVRLAWMAIVGLAVLQVGVLTALWAIAAGRKRREQAQGFPHATLPEVHVDGNALQLYGYGRDLYDAMLAAVDAAQESIYLETFIWKDDAVGREFKAHLISKARAGVAVRLVFDGFANTVVPHAFKVFPSEVKVVEYRAIRRPWHVLDPRRYVLDHRKLLIVDGSIGFLGGYNLGSVYATEWRDSHLRIAGPAAAQLAQQFVDFWNEHSAGADRIVRHYPRQFDPRIVVRDTNAMRLSFPIRDMYIAAIDRAERCVLITNAYFIPDNSLLHALEMAAKRGVTVEVLLPWNSNHPVADWLARGHFTRCLRAGIRLFGYRAMIHAKTCTIDGEWSTIGTANLDRLSAVGNYEINVEVYSRALARQMERMFVQDKTNSDEITLERWARRSDLSRLGELVLAPLRNVM